MKFLTNITLFLAILITPQIEAFGWNIPGHMLSSAIAYQILQRESPATIPIIRSILEKNPWYETRWKAQLEKLPETDRNEIFYACRTLGRRRSDQ